MEFMDKLLIAVPLLAAVVYGLTKIRWDFASLLEVRLNNEEFAIVCKAAEQGDAQAQNDLGVLYANGMGVTQDDVAAISWMQKSADQGYANGQYNLGSAYLNGQGVARDDGQAAAWFRKAADQGHAEAQYNLGMMYIEGRGVARDYAAAEEWLRKAAEQGISA